MWKAYRVVFKLRSPMHIGCGKVGNVQRTRPYVTGRVFWGALTMRLTRDATDGPATDSNEYEKFGKKVHSQLAYTYFYPAIKSNGDYSIECFWKNESLFRRCFLSSYASTALVYPQQAADEGLLHEVEFISPRTLDTGKQVYLVGYVFEEERCELQWKCACKRLQLGGERGYGWGNLQYIEVQDITDSQKCFEHYWQEQNGSIAIEVSEKSRLLAHTETTENLSAQGEIEPLVGREWRSHNSTKRYAGQHVEKFVDNLCWIPGSEVDQSHNFIIQNFGIWRDTNGRSS